MVDPINTPEMQRETLKRVTAKHGESFADLSRLIQRSDRYLDRYVREGSPKRLADREIEILSAYFRIDPRLLGGKRSMAQPPPDTRRFVPGSFRYSGTRRGGD